jgi:hypothetical protein
VLAQQAAAKKIIINTIRAGHDRDTEQAFQQIAMVGGGSYSSIQQDGGVQRIATPYDAKIAELSASIDDSSIIVGDEGSRRAWQGKMEAAAAAPMEAKADRARYYATKGSGGRAGDLIDGVATGTMSLERLNETDLPVALRGKDKAELKAEVDRRVAERAKVQQEIGELSKQRDAFLTTEANKPGDAGFDVKVKESIELQIK